MVWPIFTPHMFTGRMMFRPGFTPWGRHRGPGLNSTTIINNYNGGYGYMGGMYNFDNYMPPRPRSWFDGFLDGINRLMVSAFPIFGGIMAAKQAYNVQEIDPEQAASQKTKAKNRYNELSRLSKTSEGLNDEQQKELDALCAKYPEFKQEEENKALEARVKELERKVKDQQTNTEVDESEQQTRQTSASTTSSTNTTNSTGSIGSTSLTNTTNSTGSIGSTSSTNTTGSTNTTNSTGNKDNTGGADGAVNTDNAVIIENTDNTDGTKKEIPALYNNNGKMRVEVHMFKGSGTTLGAGVRRIAITIPGTNKMYVETFDFSDVKETAIEKKFEEIKSRIKNNNNNINIDDIEFEMDMTNLTDSEKTKFQKLEINDNKMDYKDIKIDKSQKAICKIAFFMDLSNLDIIHRGDNKECRGGYALVSTPDGNIQRINVNYHGNILKPTVKQAKTTLINNAKLLLLNQRWTNVEIITN